MHFNIKHPLLIAVAMIGIVIFICVISTSKGHRLYKNERFLNQSAKLIVDTIKQREANSIIDLSRAVSAISYLNSMEVLTSPANIMAKTGLDVHESRKLLSLRVQNLAEILQVNSSQMRNATH